MRGKADLQQHLVSVIWVTLVLGRTYATGGRSHSINIITSTFSFCIISSLCVYFIFFTASPDACADYAIAHAVSGLLFTASDLPLLRGYQPEVKKVGQTKDANAMGFWERLWLNASLVASPRHIGWTSQVPKARFPAPSTTRTQFILSAVTSILVSLLLLDITSLACHHIPMYAKGGPSFDEYPWYWRGTIWFVIVGVGAVMSMLYADTSIIGVAVRFGTPQEWPAFFGSVRDAYSVRRCWGRVWHQLLRKTVTAHATTLTQIMHLPISSPLTSFVQLYTAFLVSGLMHYAGDYMLFPSQSWPWAGPGRSFPFFLLQAVAITFEEAVIGIVKRLGVVTNSPSPSPASSSSSVSWKWKLIGYIWVFLWLSASVSWWLEPAFHAGLFTRFAPTVSVVQYLFTGRWEVSRVDFGFKR